MKIDFFESNVWFNMFSTLFCIKLDQETFLWIKCVIGNVLYWFIQSLIKIRFFERNLWFKMFCTLFYAKLDENTLLWIKFMVQNAFTLFCTMPDEDMVLWMKARWTYVSLNLKCMVQNVLYSLLHKAWWKYVYVNQVWGSLFVLCFEGSSTKIRFLNQIFGSKYVVLCFATSSLNT